ncbi:DNA-methyltransferase [Aestuariibius sp. 2305UL40-4]|uniref:DNA-methyltransferase n=1 Tax=Aestuariibius violaceus TaxID=3234132 RepID=UPI00345EAAD6
MTVQILQADVREALRSLPDESFGVVVTSPPYWGLRDYGVDGQIGLEPTLGEHLEVMVEVFDEVRRVLKPDGVCWVNYGDTYASTPNGRSAAATKAKGDDDRTFRDKPMSTIGPVYAEARPSTTTRGHNSGSKQAATPPSGRVMAGGYVKAKDLCMVPNRFAIAMQDAGWWVRAECIWGKPNPMPQSVQDRPDAAHEKVWMFTKSAKYHYQAEAVRVPRASNEDANGFRGGSYVGGKAGKRARRGNKRSDKQRESRRLKNYEPAPLEVWRIATKPFKAAHFATFPPELVERCLLPTLRRGDAVLDPFAGAGTTGLVADAMGADATLIELNPDYCDLIRERLGAGLAKVEGGRDLAPNAKEHPLLCWPDFAG